MFGESQWTLYASTGDKIPLKGARGVAIDYDGYIAIADSKPDDSYGVVGFNWNKVEQYLTVDETGFSDDEDEFDETNVSQYDEAARDVAFLSGKNLSKMFSHLLTYWALPQGVKKLASQAWWGNNNAFFQVIFFSRFRYVLLCNL